MSRGGDWPAAWVAARLGYRVRDTALFRMALTHRSAPGPNNERLEFLGDAVLNLVVAEQLYRTFPGGAEGDLSRLRARLVSREPLAAIALELGLGEELQLGSGELASGGYRRESILADALEALFGAIYLEGGPAAAAAAIAPLFVERIAALPPPEALKDAKTRLQEYLQSRSLALPCYRILEVAGADHDQTFRVSCEVTGLDLRVAGDGSSRRRAEQQAAERMLEAIAGRHAGSGAP